MPSSVVRAILKVVTRCWKGAETTVLTSITPLTLPPSNWDFLFFFLFPSILLIHVEFNTTTFRIPVLRDNRLLAKGAGDVTFFLVFTGFALKFIVGAAHILFDTVWYLICNEISNNEIGFVRTGRRQAMSKARPMLLQSCSWSWSC